MEKGRSSSANMKLILGGSGLVGSNFTDGVKLSSKDVNLLDYDETLNCIKHYNPDVIIHSACKKLSSKLLYDNSADYFDENVKISLNIFKAAATLKIEKLIVIASINAFLEANKLLLSDIFNHNIKKILSTEYYKQYGLKSNIIYLSNVFGPNYKDSRNGFIPLVIEKCYNAKKNNTDIILIGNKLHKRNFIYAKDVVNTIESQINNNHDIIISTDKSYTLKDIAIMVARIINFKGNIIWKGEYDDIKNKNINYSNEQLINLNSTPIYDALKETISWYKESKK
jgi:GDP-L-fucose synthase